MGVSIGVQLALPGSSAHEQGPSVGCSLHETPKLRRPLPAATGLLKGLLDSESDSRSVGRVEAEAGVGGWRLL